MESSTDACAAPANSARWSNLHHVTVSILCAIALIAVMTSSASIAESAKPTEPLFKEWSQDLDWVERMLTTGKPTADDLAILQERIERVKNRLTGVRATASQNLAEQRKLLEALGPPPKHGAPPESSEIIGQRRVIERAIAKWDGWVKKSELLSQRSRDLLERLASTAREIKANTLTTRKRFPLRWKVLRRAAHDADVTWNELKRAIPVVSNDFASARSTLLATSIGAGLFALVIIVYVNRKIHARLQRIRLNVRARRRRNHLAILGATVADGLIPAIAIVGLAENVLYWMPSNQLFANLLTAFSICTALLVISVAALRATFATPGGMRHTLMLEAPHARRIVILLAIASACALASLWLKMVAEPLKLGNSLYFVLAFPPRLIAAASFLLLLQYRFFQVQKRRVTFAKFAVRLSFVVLVLNPIIMVLGYGPMSDWLYFGILGTLAALVVLRLVQGASREALAHFRNRNVRSKVHGQGAANANSAGRSVLHALIFGLVQVVLWAATAGFLLFAWGVGNVQALDWLDTIKTGITIGHVRIAPLDIILAFAVFALGLGLSRLAQRAFDRRVLRRARVDAGTRNALRTCAGYTGVMIATIAAVLTLGIDLSNLALIAGALSVGVGFGMQTIVNNFVSGIILLIERPIKTGDWVVVGDCEGIVKQVRVRATEIETFQRSSVLVPNSKIISEAVVNWTFNDLTGRVDISVGVNSASDPEQVSRIMEQAAKDHPAVLELPPPHAYLRSLTHGAINFQLWAYIDVRDSRNKFRVESVLLIQIIKEFQKAGIALAQPFPALAINGPDDAQKIETRDDPEVWARFI